MARVTGPLFSLGASGQIGKALVYSVWKGLPYSRRYVIPENPRTVKQVEVRDIFATLCSIWIRMPLLARTPFDLAVRGMSITNRNSHIGRNAKVLKGQTTLDKYVMSVAGGNALPPENVVVTPAAKKATITADAPTLPDGYTLKSIVAALIEDGKPTESWDHVTFADKDETTPYSITITVDKAAKFQYGVWCIMNRTADAKDFASAAVRGTVNIPAV